MYKSVLFFLTCLICISCINPTQTPDKIGSKSLNDLTIEIMARSSDIELHDRFGEVIAVYGSSILIGATGEDGGAGSLLRNAGAAYIFEYANGQLTEITKLSASDAAEFAYFGTSVALAESIAVIGAPTMESSNGVNDKAGCVYVFEKNNAGVWYQTAILRSSDIQANDRFGTAVAVDETTIIIGANQKDNGLIANAGAVYIFEKDNSGNWTEKTIITMNESTDSANFGYSLDLNNNTLAIGAPIQEISGKQTGAAYIYKKDASGSWSHAHTLSAPDSSENDKFGYSLSLSEDNTEIAVSAIFHESSPSVTDSGAIYLFSNLNTGAQSSLKIVPSSPQQSSEFGKSIKLYNDSLLVGSPKYDSSGFTDAGCAYVFEYDASGLLSETKIITTSDIRSNDYFGNSVYFCDSFAAVGANYVAQAIDDQNSGGRIHLFY